MMLPPVQAMGSMTAMATHELQNILAIIRESAGLVGDILEVNARVGLKHRAKLDDALGHIAAQVDRAKLLLEAMHRLGHAPDADQWETCDLGPLLRALVQLCGRPARLKEVALRFTPATQPLPIEAPAIQVLAEGFTVLRAAIDLCPAGSAIDVTLQPDADAHTVVLTLPAAPAASPLLTALAEAGRVRLEDRAIHLPFPAHRP